jgi:hypothetical protein
LCPTSYTSGYGKLDYYHNPVTNRCYYVENTNAKSYLNAWNTCNSATVSGVTGGGYLFPVLTTFEFSMAAYWTGNIRTYLLWGWQNGAQSTSCAPAAGSTWSSASVIYGTNTVYTISTAGSSSLYWCKNIFLNGNLVSEPDNGGCASSGCECITTIVGNLGNCMNDVSTAEVELYICEFGG